MEDFLKWLLTEYVDENTDLQVNINGDKVLDVKKGKIVEPAPKKCEGPCEVKQEKKPEIVNDKTTEPTTNCEAIDITQNVYKDPDEETYFVRESAGGRRLSREVPIVFDFTADDGVVNPGVTDADLAFILLYRNRNNKVRYNAILDFIKSL